MSMLNRLPCSLSAVCTNVESCHDWIGFKDLNAKLRKKFFSITMLFWGHREVILRMPSRDDQDMTESNGERIRKC